MARGRAQECWRWPLEMAQLPSPRRGRCAFGCVSLMDCLVLWLRANSAQLLASSSGAVVAHVTEGHSEMAFILLRAQGR